jgi:hypothetical protein
VPLHAPASPPPPAGDAGAEDGEEGMAETRTASWAATMVPLGVWIKASVRVFYVSRCYLWSRAHLAPHLRTHRTTRACTPHRVSGRGARARHLGCELDADQGQRPAAAQLRREHAILPEAQAGLYDDYTICMCSIYMLHIHA